MLTLTDTAKEKIREYMDQSEGKFIGLRLMAHRQGRRRFRYDFSMVSEGETYKDDTIVDTGDFKIFVDPQSKEWLDGTSIDYVSDVTGSGFKIDNPQAVVSWDDPLEQRVQQVIDEQILPSLQGHGGWIELVEVKGDTAYIEFGGGCQGCGMSQVTLKDGIQNALTSAVPEIKNVEDQTDHTAGVNPYYQR